MANVNKTDSSFIQEYIPRVSRTFALTIKFLPRPLRDSVYVSYLLCRVADTLEDSPYLSPADKSVRLRKLRDLLISAAEGGGFDLSKVSSIYESVNPAEGDDHMLLSESSRLFGILDTLPESHKSVIFNWVAEMAEGMSEYSGPDRSGDGKVISLEDVNDWNRYCYYVAGTVGHMLTELFVLHYDFDGEMSRNLKALGKSFGLGLQKVNVIKDVPGDRERGRCYLPGDILKRHKLSAASLRDKSNALKIIPFVNEIIGLTVPHLDDAMQYSAFIPRHLRGVRLFLVVPVYLAMETLSLVKSYPVQAMTGPPVKLGRSDVRRLVGGATIRAGSNKRMWNYFLELRGKLIA